jgi:hypothetical protein
MILKGLKWCGEGDLFYRPALKTRKLYTSRIPKYTRSARNTRLSHTASHTGVENKVIEHDEAVEICPAEDWDICSEQNLKQALEYLGDRRMRAWCVRGSAHNCIPDLAQKPTSPPTMAITQDDVDRVIAECRRQTSTPHKEPAQAASLDGQSGASGGSLQRRNLTG